MAGVGPTASKTRLRKNAPARGEWKASPGVGWQHGPMPEPPAGLLPETEETWRLWMASWVASTWAPHHLPNVRTAIRLQDQVTRASTDPYMNAGSDEKPFFVRRPSPAAELRQWIDRLGLTRKGEQDQRIEQPKGTGVPTKTSSAPAYDPRAEYEKLRVVK